MSTECEMTDQIEASLKAVELDKYVGERLAQGTCNVERLQFFYFRKREVP